MSEAEMETLNAAFRQNEAQVTEIWEHKDWETRTRPQSDPEFDELLARLETLRFPRHDSIMSNIEVKRLEDRIEASNREWQLRAEAREREAELKREADRREWAERHEQSRKEAKADLDLALAKIDARFDRMEATVSDIKTGIGETKSAISNMKTVVINTGIAAVLTILFGVVGCLIGLKQVWIGGVQVGQSDRPAAAAPQNPTSGH